MIASLFTTKVCDILIALGELGSTVMQSEFTTQDAESLLFMTPEDANDGPYGIEVCDDPVPNNNSTWFTLVDSSGTPIILPDPGKAAQLAPITFPSWRIKPTQPASADTTFKLWKTHR